MDEKLIQKLESAVARLEAFSSGFRPGSSPDGIDDAPVDPAILAYDDLIAQFVGRFSSAAEKIGGKVLEVTKISKP
ncbi:Adenylate cyclase-associated CAP [Macleaya cordata]|uniref:Adenylate cyclase-associated CAP n=1 Tax=Macleaya cordata TaxID=56857 RepID=A0A200Q908_MACCD|nr:Adenylate cyclase-associated CAP [Macleaya cordata]